MKDFIVKYKLADGSKKKVTYDAESEREAREIAKNEGLNVVRVDKVASLGIADKLSEKYKSMKALDDKTQMQFFNQMCFMLESDINIIKAVTYIKRGAKDKKYRYFLRYLLTSMEQGMQLSELLIEDYGFAPEVKLQIRAGEKSGGLVLALQSIVKKMQNDGDTKSSIKKKMMMPAITLVVLVFVVYFLLTNVVPALSDVLTATGGSLPSITVFMINAADFMKAYGLMLIGGLAVSIILTIILEKREGPGYYIDKVITMVPFLGEVSIKSNVARYFYIASNMIGSDLTLINALEIATNSTSNKYVRKTLATVPAEMKASGTSCDILFKNLGVTNEYSDLVSTALSTGKVGDIFEKISNDAQRTAEDKTNTLMTMMEPALTIVMGGMVGLIVLSLFIPMFSIMDTI